MHLSFGVGTVRFNEHSWNSNTLEQEEGWKYYSHHLQNQGLECVITLYRKKECQNCSLIPFFLPACFSIPKLGTQHACPTDST